MKIYNSNSLKTVISILFFLLILSGVAICQNRENDIIIPDHVVTLRDAHKGTLEVDTRLLDSYGKLPENERQFYLEARSVFAENPDADFTDDVIVKLAKGKGLYLMGGPMLGQLGANGVSIWIRPATASPLDLIVKQTGGSDKQSHHLDSAIPGEVYRLQLKGLRKNTPYNYTILSGDNKVAEGNFRTAPAAGEEGVFRITFGSCFHKIGVHNPNLVNQILKREPQAMMLLGDIAVDDRENQFNMHRADYLLRDVSKPWRRLSGNVPVYATWDDHDYLNNDLSGIPDRFDETDRKNLREIWQQNWNNPERGGEGIYFTTQLGPAQLIMLDTRSCRENKRRGEYGSYLGTEQINWLKKTLKESPAPYKIVSSGTMWSDYITNGKDSWGTWDTLAREELFNFIETENISGVLFISGDRHGARGFSIPRPSGFQFYEFEAGTLGGVPGPPAMAEEGSTQLFGYLGADIIAFGEFTFATEGENSKVTFRLINQFGEILEEHTLTHTKLSPPTR